MKSRIVEHAKLVHTLVSIHPFSNGNGRLTRLLLNKLLIDDGLSPVLLRDANDVVKSVDDYIDRVLDGVKAGSQFLDEVELRSKLGLSVKNAHTPLEVRLPKRVYLYPGIELKKKSPFLVDVADYKAFVEKQQNKKVVYAEETDRLRDYVKHVKKWATIFERSKDDVEPYQIKIIDDDFIKMHSKMLSKDKESWNYKKSRYYDDSLIHRGLATHTTFNDKELIDFFASTQDIYLSMHASGSSSRFKKTSELINEDLSKFNELIEEPDEMFSYVTDHMLAQGKYYESPFLSASKNYKTANRFSKGYLTGAKYILATKGQLVVSSFKPNVGSVDLNRISKIHDKVGSGTFASKYPRQEEVSVAGAIDFDMVKRVEFRDVEVKNVQDNMGEAIAGDTDVKLVRILERNEEQPYLIKFTKQDGQGNILSETTIDLRNR